MLNFTRTADLISRSLRAAERANLMDVIETQRPATRPASPRVGRPSSTFSSAEAYMASATTNLAGAQLLLSGGPDAAMPHCLLCGYVLECLLKAYLAHVGVPEDELRAGSGPNIPRLWKQAHAKGLLIPDDPPPLFEKLSSLHNSPHYLRFSFSLNMVIASDMEAVTSLLADVVEVVEWTLRPDAAN